MSTLNVNSIQTAGGASPVLISDIAKKSDLAASDGSSLVGFIQSGTGAVVRTVQSKARESVSVLDFGAVGNGVVDDTDAIQDAINYAEAVGASVHFPSGRYRVESPVDLKSRVSLFGEGKTSSEIWFGASGQFRLTGVDGANVGFLSIQGIGLTNQGGGATYALVLNYVERILLTNCVVYGTNIGASAFSYVTVENCDLFSGELYADHPTVDRISEALKVFGCNGSGFKINVRDTTDVVIDNCSFLGGTAGITISRGENPIGFYPIVFISNTVIDATNNECLILENVCLHVTNCFFSGGRANLKNGVSLTGCTEGAILNSQVRFCGNDGLWVGNCNNITVLGCTFNDNKRNGVRVGDSNNLRFVGNTMSYAPTWYGGGYPQVAGIVDEPSNSTSLALIANNVAGNSTTAVYLPSTTNTIFGNEGYGIKASPATAVYVAGLPSAAAVGMGVRAFVQDATTNTFGALAVGGSVYTVPVFSNGTNWYVG